MAHDLIWINNIAALRQSASTPDWVYQQWHCALPLVVRRDVAQLEQIPVGIRGQQRSERYACWVNRSAIHHLITPETLALQRLNDSPFAALLPIKTLMALQQYHWPVCWGVTGSCGYALATGLPTIQANSDLDLVIRSTAALPKTIFHELAQRLQHFSCRIDIQLETPVGAFALLEWLNSDRVLLKTNTGPRFTTQPWLPID